ncbi:hypothetical protein [Clostridium pasteurianum]|uniref:Uncharacterized protein n=1 Tax=Clostridium pasteurianum BC1 TaxID=86416 RepID=R4KGF5_CLOPA|nr:hypothetical protein [Clostridium pasteurianum]AGK99589.1 hypothetical protein Clopa_4916 [Clostridium pasteurianum BC1]
MDKINFDKKDITAQIKYINDHLMHGSSFNKTCKDIGIPKSTLRDRFNKAGYSFSKETYQYVITSHNNNILVKSSKTANEPTIRLNSSKNITNITPKGIEPKRIEKENSSLCLKDNTTTTVEDKQIKNSYNYVINAKLQKDVINMLEWYKDYKDKDDQINEALKWVEDQKNRKDIIDIPEITIDSEWIDGEIWTRSFTVYKKVLNKFNDFVKKQPFTKQDLMSMALVEYMKKYNR